ncbi:MAG: GNAT family N-acetyltransferase [Brevirhabdus sp.]
MIRLRAYADTDALALFRIFHRAVHEGAARHYSKQQRDAWAPLNHPGPNWRDKLANQITVVAETDATQGPQGFMTLGRDGFLDFAYVLPEQMGRGVAVALHDRVLHIARENGLEQLETEASHLARRFFLKAGWVEIQAQQVERQGVLIPNFLMMRKL